MRQHVTPFTASIMPEPPTAVIMHTGSENLATTAPDSSESEKMWIVGVTFQISQSRNRFTRRLSPKTTKRLRPRLRKPALRHSASSPTAPEPNSAMENATTVQ